MIATTATASDCRWTAGGLQQVECAKKTEVAAVLDNLRTNIAADTTRAVCGNVATTIKQLDSRYEARFSHLEHDVAASRQAQAHTDMQIQEMWKIEPLD